MENSNYAIFGLQEAFKINLQRGRTYVSLKNSCRYFW